jgi:transcriptional regulator with XRE-family HTH domain
VTPQEQQVANKIANLMRAARKRSGMTQVEVSKILQISQSALSKIESGILIPSAPQWFEFCGATKISPDSLTTGLIEYHSPATLQHGTQGIHFKLPKAYQQNRGSKMRAMLPIVNYFRNVGGEEKFDAYFKKIKMDSEMLYDLDAQVSLNFFLDLSRMLISEGLLKAKDFSKLTESVNRPQTHGYMHRQYDSEAGSLNVLSVLLANSAQYECNFKYQIEDQKKNQVTMSVTPREHLREMSYRNDPTLGDFLCKYKQHYFERFTSYGGTKGATLRELQCHHDGADSCVYQLKVG